MQNARLRIAKPTERLNEVVRFYQDGLAMVVLSRLEDHDEFDGVMLGHLNAEWHLEFTRQHEHAAGCAPTQDYLLVFYLPDRTRWEHGIQRMRDLGRVPVPSCNPFWDCVGTTFEDPDGYRVVLQNASWTK